MSFYKNKKVLVAGGTGTIGIPTAKKLLKLGADVTVASIDSPEFAASVFGKDVRFTRCDLTKIENCFLVTKGQDFVFNLTGIKGSVGIGYTKAATYLVPVLWSQINLMEASFRNGVNRFLFVSSICAYPQSSLPKDEDSVWDGIPKQNDRVNGLAKRIGEIQAEAYLNEFSWDGVRIVRPSNVFGPHDDFNPETGQAIPALISRMAQNSGAVKAWGDGTAIRDFIFSDYLADWIVVALERAPACVPINLGAGQGRSIREIVEMIASCLPSPPKVEWDTTKPAGDPVRILSIERAKKILGYCPDPAFRNSIQKTVDWYIQNKELVERRGNTRYAR